MWRSATAIGVYTIVLAIVVGPFLAPSQFNWVEHTTSQQAGQMMSGAWLMRIGFMGFGLGILFDVHVRLRAGEWQNSLFWVFGLSMVLVAVFSHRPIDPSLVYDATDDWLHSFFATLMGFAFGFGVAWRMAFMRKRRDLVFCAVAAAASIVLPLAMWQLPNYAGLLQRLMFLISFIWFVIYLPLARKDD